MISYIALLRGVNVGGHRKLPMAELRTHLLALGYRNARTLLASGNVVFDAPVADPAELEARLEADLRRAFGLSTDVLVRDPQAWGAVIDGNPYPEEARRDPSHLLVVALKAAPAAAVVRKLLDCHKGPERIHVPAGASAAYVYYGEGMADSKLNLKALGVGTGRNWNTALKLLALVGGS